MSRDTKRIVGIGVAIIMTIVGTGAVLAGLPLAQEALLDLPKPISTACRRPSSPSRRARRAAGGDRTRRIAPSPPNSH